MKKILIVNANYYQDISKNLITSAKSELTKNKIIIHLINVPGIFEIPFTIKKYLKKYDAFIALGCVIKGKTPHFNFICKSVFDSILNISIISSKPITNGIITALNMKQALERSSNSKDSFKNNKGKEASKAVISLLKNEPKKF